MLRAYHPLCKEPLLHAGALVAQRTATDTERISLSRGMYIVKVAGVTYKVLVK